MILEYAEGGDLGEYIEEKVKDKDRIKANCFHEALVVTEQIINALDFIHNLQIVHRDLKPANVFVIDKKRMHVKLADFGIALSGSALQKDIDVSMMSMTSLRAPGDNTAPELFNFDDGEKYSKKADVYYIGKIIDKLLQPVNDTNNPCKKSDDNEVEKVIENHMVFLKEAIKRCNRDLVELTEDDKKANEKKEEKD